MSERNSKKPMMDMPDKVRSLIRGETEDGLRRFRSGNFETRLKSGLHAFPERRRRLISLTRPSWAPALGFTFAVVVIGAAVLWFIRTSPSPSAGLTPALDGLPGFRTLDMVSLPDTGADEIPAPAESVFSRALAAAAAASETGVPEMSAPRNIVPRYDLEQKMEILFGERTIERALELFRYKFKEV